MIMHHHHQTVLSDITAERHRQDFLQATGKFDRGIDDASLTDSDRLTILGEEFGEVAEHVADHIAKPSRPIDVAGLREELIQVAAVAVAWVEYLDLYASDPVTDGLAAACLCTGGPEECLTRGCL